MADRPSMVELRERLAQCARHYGGTIPREAALVWDGYFAALLEWGMISPGEHGELMNVLPRVDASPVMGVFLGWERGGG